MFSDPTFDYMSFELASRDPTFDRLYDVHTDGLAGSLLYDLSRADARRHFVPAPALAPPHFQFTFSLDCPTEEIFDELHKMLSVREPADPLVVPQLFYPNFHREERECEMEEPVEAVAPALTTTPDMYMYYESADDSSSVTGSGWDSDSDDGDSYATYASDVEAASSPRVICPLPSRAASTSSLPASQPRRGRAPKSTPTASRAVTKKRAAPKKSVSGPRKRTAISTSTSAGPVAAALHTRTRSVTPVASTSDTSTPDIIVPRNYMYLVLLGCTPTPSGGMRCHKTGCPQVTLNFADMGRHVLTHDRATAQLFCRGCPKTFARIDSLRRHLKKKGSSHTTRARRALLVKFKAQEYVKEMYALLLEDSATPNMITSTQNALDAQFRSFVADSPQH
ncbi:hypothetical protein C8R46DRAFT_1246110 [Mycena filopes]|nr:hypothetical protein C8R46DRAFT_1246110 [Mycena filopes]